MAVESENEDPFNNLAKTEVNKQTLFADEAGDSNSNVTAVCSNDQKPLQKLAKNYPISDTKITELDDAKALTRNLAKSLRAGDSNANFINKETNLGIQGSSNINIRDNDAIYSGNNNQPSNNKNMHESFPRRMTETDQVRLTQGKPIDLRVNAQSEEYDGLRESLKVSVDYTDGKIFGEQRHCGDEPVYMILSDSTGSTQLRGGTNGRRRGMNQSSNRSIKIYDELGNVDSLPRVTNRSTGSLSEDPPKRRFGKRMIIVIVGIIAVAVIAAVAIWFVMVEDSKENVTVSPTLGVIGKLFRGNMTVSTSMPCDLNTSPLMRTLSYELCSSISDLAMGHTEIKRVYNGCSVKSVHPVDNGCEVYFTMFTKVSEVVADDFHHLIRDYAFKHNQIVFGDDHFRAPNLHIFPGEDINEGTEEQDVMYVPFLRNCSVQRGDQCVTPPSQCIDGVCACPQTAYYDVKQNICQEPKISMVMSKDAPQRNEPLTITCSLLMKDWSRLIVVKESETFGRCIYGDTMVEIWNTSSGFKNYTRPNVRMSSQLQINTATVSLHFDLIECNDDGVYKCFATSSLCFCEPNLSANVSLLVTSSSSPPSKPHMSGGSTRIYLNVDYNVTCEGLVGRQKDRQPFADLALLVNSRSTPKKLTYNRTNAVSDQCQFKQSLTFSFTANSSWDGAVMTCVTTSSNGDEQHGESITISVIVSSGLQFTKPYYQKVIGQPITLTCEADNLINLTQIQITRGTINREIALITMTAQHASIEGVIIDVHNTWLQPYAGKLSVIIQNTTCADKDKFHCKAAGFIANTTVSLTRATERPTLVLSYQIVENMSTWQDRMFHCLAQLGDRSRTIDIETDINGTFSSMFKAPNELGHIFGTSVNSTADCGYSVRMNFVFNKINMTLDGVRLRCVIHPGPEESFPALTSDEKVIHVVPANHCSGEQLGKILKHVYFCSLYVLCGDGFNVNRVEKCPDGQCFSPTYEVCKPCDQAGCTSEDVADTFFAK